MINKYIKVLGIYIKPELILDIILIHLNIYIQFILYSYFVLDINIMYFYYLYYN